jgi:hypothetical protein
MRTQGRLHAVAAVAVLLLLAGCGGDDSGEEAGEAIRASVDQTLGSGSSRVALNINFSSGGTTSTVTGEGSVDMANKRGALTINLGTLGASFGASTVETVIDGQQIYVKLPPGVLPGGTPWFKLDLAAAGRQGGINLGSLSQLQQQADPTQILAYLKGATDDAREVGEEDVRGESTTHYRSEIDLRRAADSLPAESRPAIEEAIATLGTSTFPLDAWIDDGGRLRRMEFSVDPDGTGPSAPGSVQMELFDFGVPVNVQPPPANQVTDITQLLQGGTVPTTTPPTTRRR